jgi:3-deoxy-7-phosphoheptulonate synthase
VRLAGSECAPLVTPGPHQAYRTVSRFTELSPAHPDTTLVRVGRATFGGPEPVVIAGPCAVESAAQTLAIARAVCRCGANMLRGGAYKPRTSPYDFQGLGEDGLKILAEARAETGLPVVTEVIDVRLVEQVARYADMLQIGSRSMQNFPLLVEAGKSGKPVLLKRSMAATMHEWLCAAEYIACQGNLQIVFCERGVRSAAAGEYSRFLLDLNVVSALRAATHLPVIVDPSHATGRAEMVPAAARAAIACGAHGLIVEVIGEETTRDTVRCDASQAIRPAALRQIVLDAHRITGDAVEAAGVR